jgi:hypothetical protein
MENPLHYGEYLDRIASNVKVRGESRPRKKDLPRRVLDIVVLVEEIEKLILPPSGRWERSELPKEIQNLLTNRNILRTLVSDIERELGRATGRPVNTRLPIEGILPETKAIVNSLESIQREVRSEGHERIPLTQLAQHIRQILDEYYHKTKSSREILKRISRRIDPTNSEPSNFEDLPSKVALLVNNQASKRDDIREKRTPNSEQMDSKDGSETEGKMKWCTDRVNELEGSVEEYRQREEKMKNAAKESNDLLTKAVEEANQLRTTVNAKQIEIDKMKATEIDLRHSQVSLKNVLDEAKQHLRTTLEAKQVEIQKLKATEKNLRDSNAGAMKRAETEKDTAIAEVEKRHGEQIEKLTAKHAGELTDQKTSVERQHKAEMVAQRKKHNTDKQGIESRHHLEKEKLQGLHDAELKEQREHAETLQAELAEEVHQHAHSQAGARKRTKEHEAQRIALERQHAQNLAEQRKLHSSALERAEVDKIEQLDVLRKEHNRQITESEKTWKLKFAQVVRDHEAEEIEWEEALRLEEARSIKKVEEEAQKHKLVIEMLETELRVEKARTTEKVEEEAQKHKNTIEKLEMRCQKLQGILLKQDDYSGLTDLEIVRGVTSKTGKASIVGFTNMVSKVTTFSEWEWREDREIWSKETMTALVGTKQRRLKKLILGDAIWTTLFQLIFCSPFRILGKEGEHLEADWNGSFPSGMIVERINLADH